MDLRPVLHVPLSLYNRFRDHVLTELHLEAGSSSPLKVTIQIWQGQVQCPKANCHFEKQSSGFCGADCLQLHLETLNRVTARSWLISRGTNEPALPEVFCALWFLTASLADDSGPPMSLTQAAPSCPSGHRRLVTQEKVLLSGAFRVVYCLSKYTS